MVSPLTSYVYLDTLTDSPSQPNVASPLVSYLYQDSLAAPPEQPNVVSPLVSYVYYDWPGDENLTFQNSPLVSYFFQSSTVTGQFALSGRVTDKNGVALSSATVSVTVGLTQVAQTTTDGSGNYALPQLGAGAYLLWVWDATHQTSIRALTLSSATALQNFQLNVMPGTPTVATVNRQPDLSYTVTASGSALRVFDGSNFVTITLGNTPPANRMTIVLTHGMNSNPTVWATNMAAQLRAHGVTAALANIVAWDWRTNALASGIPPAPPVDKTGTNGLALGQALLGVFGAGGLLNRY